MAIAFPMLSKVLSRIRQGDFLPLIFAALLILCGVVRLNPAASAIQSILRPILMPLMIISTVVFPQGLVSRFLDLPVMRFIGKISYSLYLWQQPFLILNGASARGNGLGWWQHWPLALVGLVVCAIASYYFVERPMIRLGGRLHRQVQRKRSELALPAEAST
jgi:peptidoglycan/LPS O-acetylase OafA/YrhL